MFKNMKLKTKLLAAFCFVSAIALIIGIIGYRGMMGTMNELEHIVEIRMPSVESLLVISEAQTAVYSTEYAMLNPQMTVQERQNQAARCSAAYARAMEAWKVYEALPKGPRETALWNNFVPKWDAWWRDHEEFHRMNRLDKTDEVWAQLSHHALNVEMVSFEAAEELLVELVELNKVITNEAAKNAAAVAAGALRLLVLTIIIGILMAIGLGFLISQMITRPVAELVNAANTAASGDLTVDIKASTRDEIGELSLAFKKMVAEMREIIQQVVEKSRTVASSSQQLNASSQQTAASANETSATMGEISSTVEQVTSNIQEISSESKEATEHANKGDQGIARITEQMKNITASTGDVSQAIEGLSKKSQEINQIVDLITSIADQTNLLALNAAIEAARAGEQGRGFAVVAEEVRKLAEQSASAAKEIYQLINTIQAESNRAVDSMAIGGREVEVGTQIVRDVGESFKQIIGSVQNLTRQIQEIASATGQMSAGVQNVAAATEEQTASMEEVSASATSLSSLADELNALVSKFKV